MEYKIEGFNAFNSMIDTIQTDVLRTLYRIRVESIPSDYNAEESYA